MNVTVPQAKLLETMKTNRAAHHDKFLAAQKQYRKVVIAELDRRLKDARKGGVIDLGFALPVPVDYTEQYDDAIARLEWNEAVDGLVRLSEDEFKQFVLDKWGWERHWAANTESYLVS